MVARVEEETVRGGRKEKNRLNAETPHVSFLHTLAGFVGAGYLYLVGKTSFIHSVDHPAALEIRRKKSPVIYAFWHNAQVFLAYEHRREHVNIMVSRSKDGEYIAQVMKRLGLDAVRGSSSKGGEQALREMVDLVQSGKQVGFTPDGPRGPLQTVHGGVIMTARATGVPIVPVTYTSARRLVFKSWDKFVLPLPFSTIVVSHGRPFTLDKNLSDEDAKQRVRQALNENVESNVHAFERTHPWSADFLASIFTAIYTTLTPLFALLSFPYLLIRYKPKRTFGFLGERFKAPILTDPSPRRLWLHAASIGEWQALRPLLARFRKIPGFSFVITVSTPEARLLVAREASDAVVRLLPIDIPWILARWIKRVDPFAIGIVETELWPNLIRSLHRRYVPVFIMNGRLSKRSVSRWETARPFAHNLMSFFSYFYVRTDLDARHYVKLGAPLDRVAVTGNTKYDNLAVVAPEGSAHVRSDLRRKLFGSSDGVIVVAGSTWPGEEKTLLRLFSDKNAAQVRLILAPRRAARFDEVARLLESTPASWSRWSKIKQTNAWETDILLVDTLGDLKELYRTADIAFVGGTLTPHGGQNPLEPAAAGLPVLFGPSMENFHEEAAQLKHAGAARAARHEKDLLSDIREMAADLSLRSQMGAAAARFVQSKQGASDRTVDALKEWLGL